MPQSPCLSSSGWALPSCPHLPASIWLRVLAKCGIPPHGLALPPPSNAVATCHLISRGWPRNGDSVLQRGDGGARVPPYVSPARACWKCQLLGELSHNLEAAADCCGALCTLPTHFGRYKARIVPCGTDKPAARSSRWNPLAGKGRDRCPPMTSRAGSRGKDAAAQRKRGRRVVTDCRVGNIHWGRSVFLL